MMVFYNPGGAPELACNTCGCRWYDRLTNTCYECGEEVTEEALVEYQAALAKFYAEKGIELEA